MRTKLLKKLRHKYFDLYFIKYSDEDQEWELYTCDLDMYDNCYQEFVCSAKELSDVQNRLRERVQNHIVKYLRDKGREPLGPSNKYLW